MVGNEAHNEEKNIVQLFAGGRETAVTAQHHGKNRNLLSKQQPEDKRGRLREVLLSSPPELLSYPAADLQTVGFAYLKLADS